MSRQIVPVDEADLVRLPGVIFLFVVFVQHGVVDKEVVVEAASGEGRPAGMSSWFSGTATFAGTLSGLHVVGRLARDLNSSLLT